MNVNHGKRLTELVSQLTASTIYNSYDIIGDIAIIKLPENSKMYGRDIAEAIMATHRNVKTVMTQTSAVSEEFRLRELKHVSGKHKTQTVHREAGCFFCVDIKKCYFSPRLSFERMRITDLINEGETVVNMFAGVGCFSILIAKYTKAKKVYSIDVNPAAFHFMVENIRVNGAYGKVIPILGDAKEVLQKKLHGVADRVLMPLPEKALECIPQALIAFKNSGGWLHYYGSENGKEMRDAVERTRIKISEALQRLEMLFEIPSARVVRSTGPNRYQVVLDIQVGPIHRESTDRKAGGKRAARALCEKAL